MDFMELGGLDPPQPPLWIRRCLNGVLGQVLYDVCVPKNVDGWDLKPSASSHMHTVARRHGSFNPMKCVRRSRL